MALRVDAMRLRVDATAHPLDAIRRPIEPMRGTIDAMLHPLDGNPAVGYPGSPNRAHGLNARLGEPGYPKPQ